MATAVKVTPEAKKVLRALAKAKEPLPNKQLAAAAGLDAKQVSAAVKDLKQAGLVDCPARCKYGITAAGKKKI
ncbi:MAG: winged helix-turn-helix transcriptional regulator [Desulfarculus sp.]|jgi:Mn-dependent DtxR family transcriptional regulator|nr:MAG: winged helix-turn-helix transcriptional regulator [Desulfarculus sp.]